MKTEHGHLLTSHVYDNAHGIVLSYYGCGPQGPFKLEFSGEKIVFFISRDSNFSPQDFQFERKQSKLKNFSHLDVDAIYLNKFSDIQNAKNYCLKNSIRTFELDVPITERFLMERFIFGAVEFRGNCINVDNVAVYKNPEIRKTNYSPQFKVLSLDIETGVAGELYSIGLHQRSANQENKLVLILNEKDEKVNSELQFFESEKKLLMAFLSIFKSWDPDLIIGWHVIGFDLMFLEKKCQKLGLELNIGRDHSKAFLDEKKGVGFFARITGRIVLDGPPVLRSAFYQFSNFKLETVATEVLNTSKDIASDSGKVTEIERRFKDDKLALAKYNLLDCTLVLDIFEKLSIIDLLKKRIEISGLLMDRLALSTAAFDFVFLPALHRKGYVAPNRIDIIREEASVGGMVIEPKAGLHKNVSVFDFKSLYPSIIRTFFIDPYSKIQYDKDTVITPKGYEFSKTESILPAIIENLLNQRQMAKNNGDKALSQAVKILMNSFYGVMGSSRCRFYHADLPSAITTTGHYILQTTMSYFESLGHEVIYGDTDSIFITTRDIQTEEMLKALAKNVDRYLTKHLLDNFKVKSRLECEYEKSFSKIFFSMARSGDGAAKKRYAGIYNDKLEFKGMEFVRTDWTDLAKTFQKNLFEKFFKEEDLEAYIKDFIKSLEIGLFDDQLVYTKRLSKAPEEYVKNVPPHVKAALKIDHTGPYRLKEVSYVMTPAGPEPINNHPSKFDYQHYIERQLKPIADDILVYQNKSFDSFIIGDQLSFF